MTDFLIAGDDFQQINNFGATRRTQSNHDGDVVLQLAKLLRIENVVYLRQNHRSTNEIVDFINGFLPRVFPNIRPEYLYSKGGNFPWSPKPEIRLFQNMNEQIEYVRMLSDEFKTKLTILARTKRSLELLRTAGISAEFFTISSFRGRGSKIVVIFDFGLEDNLDRSECMVNYVGLSRACETLIITSSFPARKVLSLFEPGTYHAENTQYSIGKPYARLLEIIKNFSTLMRYNKSSIDSIAFSVAANVAPFQRYVQQDGSLPKFKWDNRRKISTPEGVTYTLKFHHTHKKYSFDFSDLNLLRFSGYTDTQIVRYLKNIILEYFDFRLESNHINLSKIHVSKVHKFRSKIGRASYLAKVNAKLNRAPVKIGSKQMHDGSALSDESLSKLEKTAYFNFRKDKSFTFVVYDPGAKEDANKRFPDNGDSFAKVELRFNTRQLITQKRFLGKNCNIDSLIALLRKDFDLHNHLFKGAIGFDPDTSSVS